MIGERFGPVAIVVVLLIFGVLMAMEILGKLFPSDVRTWTTWPDQSEIGAAERRATTDEPGQVKKREQGENEARNTSTSAFSETSSEPPRSVATTSVGPSSNRSSGPSTTASSPMFSGAPSSGGSTGGSTGDSTGGGSTGDSTGGGGGGSTGGSTGGVVEDTVDTVGDTVDNTTGAVKDTVDQPTGEVLGGG
jgi:hypothetical protein